MSDNIKLIIEIPKEAKQAFDKAESNDLKGGYYDHGGIIGKAIQNGIPLDSVKAEIEQNAYPIVHGVNNHEKGMTLYGILQVLDNIDKVEKEGINDRTISDRKM